jgi:hypothetical protein
MALDLVVVSVSRRADGLSLIGYGAAVPERYGFVRLVAPTPNGVLYPEQHRMHEAAEPRPFDLVRVEAPWADSRPTQPENRVVNGSEWELLERPASRPNLTRLERAPVTGGPLFGTSGPAVRATGFNLTESIVYVNPQDTIAVCDWDERKEKYRARLNFMVSGTRYDLPLTDWRFSKVLRRRGEGNYSLDQLGCRAAHGLRLVVTLGEPFHGWCYKMVSGILPLRIVTPWRVAASLTRSGAQRNAAGA